MKIRPTVAIGLAAIAALSSTSIAQDCLDGDGLCEVDFVGPLIDGDRNGPTDPGQPKTPQLRWSSFENVTADIERTTINHFGDTVIVRRFGQTTAWGGLSATAGDTFAADSRLTGVESADFYTLGARGNSPTENYAVMLKFETGVMSHDDVLTIGQLFRDNATALTSARINASYQGVAVDLADFEIFNMDLVVDSTGTNFVQDMEFNALTKSFASMTDSSNSDFMMFRPLEGVLIDKIDIFIDSTRPDSPYPDKVEIGLGSFVVPAPGSAALLGIGFLAARRRRR